ncbi:MAG: pyruvate kinase [Victivallaceae bacterium]|nr:pyruvate kinase [Victivallaceae bacterium]
MKSTKIIATIGPACASRAMLEKIIRAGVDVCRLNFSFGTHAEHREKFDRIRAVSKQVGKAVAVIQDLQGPKIRVGRLRAAVTVKPGDTLTLSGGTVHRDRFCLPTAYKNIAADTEPGKTILMMDGRIVLQVKTVEPAKKLVHCVVKAGGTILTGKGINLPYTRISLPSVTAKDKRDALLGIELGVDFIAQSFVRSAADVAVLKRYLKRHGGGRIPVIAKLEKPEALENLEEIIAIADGVMVARGDLADEIFFAKVPMAQKRILTAANRQGKLTIVATEMLSSMTANPLPTRAEVSDVANSVLDGTDLVMLSNESAMGKYPVAAVRAMSSIVAEAEQMIDRRGFLADPLVWDRKLEVSRAMCLSASFLSHELNEKAIAVLTTTGESVRILSKYRPETPIYAATYSKAVYHRMAAYSRVAPLLLDGEYPASSAEAEKALALLKEVLRRNKIVKTGETVICLTGLKAGDGSWRVNSLHTVTI